MIPISEILHQTIIQNILITVVLCIIFYIIRSLIYSRIDKNSTHHKDSAQQNLLIKKNTSQTLQYILLFLLVFVWLYQYKEALFSLVAIAAAMVVALKEIIMCLTGGLLIKISRAFHIGDRIEIGHTRGFVINTSLLTFTILEIGPEKNSQQMTGDVITLPNSLALSTTIKNQSYFQGYSIKTFSFYIDKKQHFEAIEKHMLQEAKNICQPYLQDASIYISKFCEREKLELPNIEARSKISLDGDKIHLILKLPVNNNQIADVEQRLFRTYVSFTSTLS